MHQIRHVRPQAHAGTFLGCCPINSPRPPPLPRVVNHIARFGEPGTVGGAGVEEAAGEEEAIPSLPVAAAALTS